MSDSATDSVPDLDLVIPNTNVKKKKVRLLTWQRKFVRVVFVSI